MAERYLVAAEGKTVYVVLHKQATTQELVRAYVHGLYLTDQIHSKPSPDTSAAEVASLIWMDKNYSGFLKVVSWNNLLCCSGLCSSRSLQVSLDVRKSFSLLSNTKIVFFWCCGVKTTQVGREGVHHSS